MKTLHLKASEPGDLETAAQILRGGGVAAIPTETVYGLAANALDPRAVAKIFEAKGRPQDNPLIVHVSSFEEIAPLISGTDERLKLLADNFWPGPLTVIMKKSDKIPSAVSAGLDTVAIRMPSHPAAREIIRLCGCPLAAPSANTSGKPSPTDAERVIEDMEGRIDAVVDGGACGVGVESTVITLAADVPTILRPGGVTPAQLEAVLGRVEISHAVFENLKKGERAQSPGMKYKHYAPNAKVTLIKSDFATFERYVKAQKKPVCAVCFDGEGKNFETAVEYGAENDKAEQARRIFEVLREVDETGCEEAFVRSPEPEGIGLAVYNRLLRAAAFRELKLDFSIPVYGLTGQTGSGKGEVGRILAERGFCVIDTDALAREVIAYDRVLAELKEIFGGDIESGGVINRALIAERAFSSPGKTAQLNSVMHPEIILLAAEKIHLAEKDGKKAAFIDAPVLFETALPVICKKVICVTAPADIRTKRIMARDGISESEARLRMSAQKSEEEYTGKSDYIINNSGGIDETEKAVDEIIREESL